MPDENGYNYGFGLHIGSEKRMKISAQQGDITTIETDGILVSLSEGTERVGVPASALAQVDKLLGGAIRTLVESKSLKGKAREVVVIPTLGRLPSRMVAVCGLGAAGRVSADSVRDAAAEGARALRKMGCKSIATPLIGAGVEGVAANEAARGIVEGVLLGLYEFAKYKASEMGQVETLVLVATREVSVDDVNAAIREAEVVAESTCLARDMANEPSNYMTPTRMADMSLDLASKHGFEATILERADMEELGMGGLLAVARGSAEPPKFIRLSHSGGNLALPHMALVGKAITFDSGGISIKPSEGMSEMKGDMSGGASVVAAMCAVARMNLAANVTCLIPATENLPGGSAFKPGDVVRAMNGKSIEIISTDAEGRLVLADALSYANKHGMTPLIDIATLTGACKVALGSLYSGVFSNDDDVLARFMAASVRAGDKMWHMPLPEEYKEMNSSPIADVKNVGNRYGGAITAALFVGEFAGDTPWVHVDIAGTADATKDSGATVKGATGVPVRTLYQFVKGAAGQG
jgi:leucyl aminopeptidase